MDHVSVDGALPGQGGWNSPRQRPFPERTPSLAAEDKRVGLSLSLKLDF
jgi:hypothetical protein